MVALAVGALRGVVTVVPLTSSTARVLALQVLVPADGRTGLAADSAHDGSPAGADRGRTVRG